MYAVILTVPRITPQRPSIAPAIIKSIFTEYKKDSKIIDINIDFYNNFSHEIPDDIFHAIDHFLYSNETIHDSHLAYLNQWIDKWIDHILSLSPKHILISVFTWHGQKFTKLFLERLRPRTGAKIIIGGQGIGEIREQTSWIGIPLFAHQVKQLNLIDHWIKGDAETTIPLICNGIYEGNGFDSDSYSDWHNLKSTYIPDFSDFNVKSYHSGVPNGVIPLEFSRGCVRQCNFCDWVTSGGGFRTKTGQQVFAELIHNYESFGVTSFYFNDALINGSIKEFNTFNKLLLDYYKKHNLPDRYFMYSGHFIIRGPHQGWKKEYIRLMGKAGANSMVVGVETGSDNVRKSMNKDFSLADLDFNMEEFVKYDIKMYMLMMIGYPTETNEDFELTLNLIKRYQKYVASGNISGINLGQTFVIEEGAPIFYHPENLELDGVNGDKPKDVFWINPKNPSLTYKQRILRRIKAQELAMELGYPIWRADGQLEWITKKYQEITNKVYNGNKTRI